jgi:hypothetical protein
VLANAPLRPGFDRADLSRYGDARWDLGPAVFRENATSSAVTVDFESIGDPIIAEAVREYLYARLNIDLPGCKARALPVTVSSLFYRALRFFNFVKIQHGVCNFGRIDQALLDRYVKVLQNGRRPVIVMQLLGVVFDLYAFRQHLRTAALWFEPWPGRTLSQVAGYRFIVEENRTPRIPENIITPLLAWSLKYVTVFAPDILAARSELMQLEERRAIHAAEDAMTPRSERRARRRACVIAYKAVACRSGRCTSANRVACRPALSLRHQSIGSSCTRKLASMPTSKGATASNIPIFRTLSSLPSTRSASKWAGWILRFPSILTRGNLGGRALTPGRSGWRSAYCRLRATSSAHISPACAIAKCRPCGQVAYR